MKRTNRVQDATDQQQFRAAGFKFQFSLQLHQRSWLDPYDVTWCVARDLYHQIFRKFMVAGLGLRQHIFGGAQSYQQTVHILCALATISRSFQSAPVEHKNDLLNGTIKAHWSTQRGLSERIKRHGVGHDLLREPLICKANGWSRRRNFLLRRNLNLCKISW